MVIDGVLFPAFLRLLFIIYRSGRLDPIFLLLAFGIGLVLIPWVTYRML